eukprot:TRINITY_DN862_c0_g2_i4.p1 TRINITY_DN862_c0_g2~~TRINITY_DN862_c0_g2_i4.p1  ORF type:complete len:268 (-),score=-23.86 TRINITY_DN862_c0_g2_i4:91-894(-)
MWSIPYTVPEPIILQNNSVLRLCHRIFYNNPLPDPTSRTLAPGFSPLCKFSYQTFKPQFQLRRLRAYEELKWWHYSQQAGQNPHKRKGAGREGQSFCGPQCALLGQQQGTQFFRRQSSDPPINRFQNVSSKSSSSIIFIQGSWMQQITPIITVAMAFLIPCHFIPFFFTCSPTEGGLFNINYKSRLLLYSLSDFKQSQMSSASSPAFLLPLLHFLFFHFFFDLGSVVQNPPSWQDEELHAASPFALCLFHRLLIFIIPLLRISGQSW